jgi:hypothetical protein
MKKQRQNISSILPQEESSTMKAENSLPTNVNLANDNINNSYSDFTQNKRERENSVIEDMMITGTDSNKKQKVENPLMYTPSIDPYANILNNHNNNSLTSLTNNQPSTFNIINNPHSGNLNVNLSVNAYVNPATYQSKKENNV